MNCENAKSIREWLPAWGWYSRSKHPETITPFNNNFDWNFKFPFHKGGFSMLRIHNCGVNEPSPCKRKRRVGLEISLQCRAYCESAIHPERRLYRSFYEKDH